MRRVLLVGIAVMVMAGLVLGYAAPSVAKPVKFKAVAFLPVNNDDVRGFKIFTEMVNKKFKDHINIEILGGPEVTPPFQLHNAVKKGVIDMCHTSTAYYPSLLWEAQSAMFTNKNYKERYQTNYYEVMSKLHEKVGLIWMDSANHNQSFHLFSNVMVKKPSDLAGKKIRVFPAFIPLIKALGAVPVNLPMGDIYTAMERGAVDGFVMTHLCGINITRTIIRIKDNCNDTICMSIPCGLINGPISNKGIIGKATINGIPHGIKIGVSNFNFIIWCCITKCLICNW